MTTTIQSVNSVNSYILLATTYDNFLLATQSAIWSILRAGLNSSSTPSNAKTKNVLNKIPKEFWRVASYPYVIVNIAEPEESHFTYKDVVISASINIEIYYNKTSQLECVDYVRKLLNDNKTFLANSLALQNQLLSSNFEVVDLPNGTSIYKYTITYNFEWVGN